MINKIYKRIHNNYSNFFKYFFFLRYVFAIFLIITSLFLLIPKFFNYEKKQEIIKEYFINYYGLELSNYDSIRFNVFPLPNLSIKNANLKFKNKPINLKSKNLNIFLNFKNIYNYEDFQTRKILFIENDISLDIDRTKDLINYFSKLKYKLDFKTSDFNFKKDDSFLLKIKNVNFSNHGYKKYHINGEIFDKKFTASLKNNNQNLSFKILNTGIKANFKIDEKNLKTSITGSSNMTFLDNFLQFDFILNGSQLEISKSNFNNKDLSFSLDSLIAFNPFFSTNSNININEIDKRLIDKINLEKILNSKEIIKKLNSKININYKKKRYYTNLIENYSSDLNLAYGKLVFSNKILITGGEINCQGDSLIVDEYPRLNLVCLFEIKDKKKLFKKFSIYKNINSDPLSLHIESSINLLNRKINFKKINTGNNYFAKEEDMKYFKELFESILFDESFLAIFNMDKIKEFFLEIN